MNNQELNSCYTYFKITGNFNTAEISKMLGLTSKKQWNIGDLRSNGTKFDFSLWEYGRCEDYEVLTSSQMMKTIKDLVPKINILNKIKKLYDVTFTLEIVPSIHEEDKTPCLAPNREVIKFCYETETDIDIDLYVYYSENVV